MIIFPGDIKDKLGNFLDNVSCPPSGLDEGQEIKEI